MGQIISITRKKCVIGILSDDDNGILELEAPRTFVVGVAPDDESPTVKAINYNANGNVWLRAPHYEVLFNDSTVKRIVLQEEVIDIAVDMANASKKKKKAPDAPDLSAPDLTPVEEGE